jgi:hypothetical protein
MKRRVVLIGLASFAMLSAGVTAVADPTPDDPPTAPPSATAPPTREPGPGEDEGVLISNEEAVRQDAQEFAKQKGVSEADAIAAMRNQPAMEEFIAGIQSAASDRLAGAWIELDLTVY